MNDIKTWADMITCSKRFDGIEIFSISRPGLCDMPSVHLYSGVRRLAAALGCKVEVVPWEGNADCGTNYDSVQFVYNGHKFFQLVSKESE